MFRLLSRNTLTLLALALLLASVLIQPIERNSPVYHYQITFDISQSMNVRDYVIDDGVTSRLSFARLATSHLLRNLPCGSSVGFSVFTGRRVITLLTPIEKCQHYAGLLTTLNLINNDMRWANSSGIGKGLHQSIRTADALDENTRVIFFTDGQEAPPLRTGHRGMPNTDKFSVDGIVAGVGGTVPVRIPKTLDQENRITSYWLDNEVVQHTNTLLGVSHEELSHRHDKHLGNLARLSNLHYQPLDSVSQLTEAAMNQRLSDQVPVPVDLSWIPAAIALLLLILRFTPTIIKRQLS